MQICRSSTCTGHVLLAFSLRQAQFQGSHTTIPVTYCRGTLAMRPLSSHEPCSHSPLPLLPATTLMQQWVCISCPLSLTHCVKATLGVIMQHPSCPRIVTCYGNALRIRTLTGTLWQCGAWNIQQEWVHLSCCGNAPKDSYHSRCGNAAATFVTRRARCPSIH